MARVRCQYPILAIAREGAYVDVRYPMQGTDHGRFWNVVAGVQGQNQEADTGGRLSRGRVTEPRRDGAEVCLHNQRYRDNEKEEDATGES